MLALGSTLAHADTSLIATGSASTGYSSNIFGVPETDNPAVGARVQGDGFTDLAPGLAAAYEHRRGIHNLNYIFGARLFLRNSEANSYNNTVSYQNILAVSPRGSLRMGASFNSGRVNAFDQAGNEAIGEGNLLPDGDVEFIAYNVGASYRHQLSQTWTGETSLAGGRFLPTGGGAEAGDTTNLENRIRFDRTFRRHLVGVDFRTAYNKQEAPDLQRTLTTGPGVLWTWNVSESISTNSSAGLDIVGDFPSMQRGITVPRYAAAVTYSHERGRATVGYGHGVTTNLFGGDTTITDSVFSNISLPLPTKRPMVVGLAAAYAKGEIIDIDSEAPRGDTERASADITLAMELTRVLQLGFRLETSKQTQNDVLGDGMEFEAITRQTQGLVVITGRFPGTAAGQVPRRNSDRVESGDADFGGGTGASSAAGAGDGANASGREQR